MGTSLLGGEDVIGSVSSLARRSSSGTGDWGASWAGEWLAVRFRPFHDPLGLGHHLSCLRSLEYPSRNLDVLRGFVSFRGSGAKKEQSLR